MRETHGSLRASARHTPAEPQDWRDLSVCNNKKRQIRQRLSARDRFRKGKEIDCVTYRTR